MAKSDCCEKLNSLGGLALLVAVVRVDDNIPALNDVVVAAEVDLVNAKFSIFGLEADDWGNKLAKGLDELSLVIGNLLSPEDDNEPLKVNPEVVRTPPPPPLAADKEGCGMPNDICLVLDPISLSFLWPSNLNVTDLAVVTAGLFKGGSLIDSFIKLLPPTTGSTLEVTAFSVSSAVASPADLFRPRNGKLIPPKLSVTDALSVFPPLSLMLPPLDG